MNLFEASHLPVEREPWRTMAADAPLVMAVVVVALGLAATAALPLSAAAPVVALVTAGVLWRFHSRGIARRFGLANWATLLRVNLMVLLLLAIWPGPPEIGPSWSLFVIAFIALLLDGIDGWLARRRQEASDFGERFDMTADTAFTVILTVCLATAGLVGPWVLLIGLMRPAFVQAGRLWPALTLPLPPSRGRKVVCAMALCCLVAGLAPALAPLAPTMAVAALALLVGSFGRDLHYLWRSSAGA